MADIELVIKIPEKDYEMLNVFKKVPADGITARVYVAIANGTPLPKGHGRLIDMEKLLDTFWTYCKQGNFGYHQAEDLIKSALTIIEADKDKEVNADADSN